MLLQAEVTHPTLAVRHNAHRRPAPAQTHPQAEARIVGPIPVRHRHLFVDLRDIRVESASRCHRDNPAAQAALLVRHGRVDATLPKERQRVTAWRHRLERACLRFDDAGANAVVADAAHEVGLLVTFKDVILPVVAQLGDAWHEGLINISQEHFVSQLAHRVAQQVCRVDASVHGSRPRVLTGCAPNERHELGLLLLVAELRARGYAVTHLGCEVPPGAFLQALDATRARVAVIGVTMAGHLRDWVTQVQQIRRRKRRRVTFVWAGPGADAAILPGLTTLSVPEAVAGIVSMLDMRAKPAATTMR